MIFDLKKLHSDKKNKDYYALCLVNKENEEKFIIVKFLTNQQYEKLTTK